MKKHERARRLAEAMSVWIYSTGTPPKKLNALFLKWLETHDVPSYGEIQNAQNALPDKPSNVKVSGSRLCESRSNAELGPAKGEK